MMQDYTTLLQEGSRDSKALGENSKNVFERHLSTIAPQKRILNACLVKILSTRGISQSKCLSTLPRAKM
jgi:hypothetical protein